MKDIFSELDRHLSSLGAAEGKWDVLALGDIAPPALAGWYRGYEGTVAGKRRPILVAVHEGLKPDVVVDHAARFSRLLGSAPVFAFPSLDREFARRLRAARIDFVVPRRLVHLPPRFVLLPETGYSEPPERLPAHLSPTAQLVLLWLLQAPDGGGWTEFGTLRKRLVPNRVYLTLAVQELERRDFAETHRDGLRKSVRPAGARRAVWTSAQEALSSPVLRIRRVIKAPAGLPAAGLTALARFSRVNDAPPRCVAALRRSLAFKADSERRYDGDVVQEWKYDPRLLAPAGGGTVDPLSLFLSLRNETDPRVQSALGECLETIRW